MRMSLLTVLAVLGVGLLLAPAGAAVFSADFEAPTYTTGAIPDASTPQVYYDFGGWGTNKFPPLGNEIIGKPVGSTQWDFGGYDSNPANGGDIWQNTAFVTVDPVNPANHVAAFVGGSSQGPINASGAGVLVGLNTTNDITLSFQMFYPSARNDPSTPVAAMYFMNQNLTFGTSHMFSGQWDGTLCFNFNGTDYLVSKDAWHTAALTINPTTSKASFSVDGNSVVSNATVDLGGFSGLARFNYYQDDPEWFRQNNPNGALLMDNFSIAQTPEPMTLTLLALGGLAIIRRRHA